jgi:hypothetical protein
MIAAEFWRFAAEPEEPPMDPMRFQAEAFKYSQDVIRKRPRYSTDMPGTYSDRNVETTGAVTAS